MLSSLLAIQAYLYFLLPTFFMLNSSLLHTVNFYKSSQNLKHIYLSSNPIYITKFHSNNIEMYLLEFQICTVYF